MTSRILGSSLRPVSMALALFTLSTVSHAATITKSATGTDLAVGTNWGGTAPGSADVATWNTASLGAGLTLDSNTSWGGVAVTGALTNIGITGAGTLTLGAGGIDISTSTRDFTVANPIALEAGQTWNVNSGRTLTASGAISGGFGLTKSGAGSLTLSVANSYSGGTTVNTGTLTASISGALGTGTVAVNGGTLAVSSGGTTHANSLTLNGGTLNISFNGSTPNWTGPVTLTANSTIGAQSSGGGGIVSGNIGESGGAFGFTKTGNDRLAVTGTSNTYNGPTIVSAGLLTFRYSLYGNNPVNWIPANITVNSAATLALNVGGAGEFTASQAGTLFSQLATSVTNNGLRAGSIMGFDLTNATGIQTVSATLTDATGTGAGPVGLNLIGTGNTLELTGPNTFSGPVTTDRNNTLKVASLNSVATNPVLGTVASASSNLGTPTDVTKGTISLGNQSTYGGGTLLYTGTGETTDRVIKLGGANGQTYTLEQAGSGLLKFVSDMTHGDNRGPKTFQLQGSSAGAGEFAGVIVNPTGGTLTLALTKSGSGTWTLSGANYHQGITTLNAGVLSVSTISDGGLTPTLTTTAGSATVNASSTAGLIVGQSVISSKIPVGATIATIVDSTTFTLNSGSGVTAGTAQASTIGTRSNLGTAPAAATNLVFNGGNLQFTGSSTSTNRNFTINAGKVATFDITANNLTLTGASTATNGALTKTGLGTLTLAGANLATGATTVSQGTLAITGSVTSNPGVIVNSGGKLLVNNTSGSGTGGAAVTVNNGGSLGGTGTINGTVTVNSGGTITLGNTSSTLSLATATSPTFNAFGTLKVNAASNTLDKVSLTNSAANFACGNLDLVVDTTDLARAFSAVEIVRTTKSNGVTGTFRSVSVIGNPAYTAIVSYAANSITLTVSGGSSSLPAAYKIQVAGSGSATTTAGSGVNLTITALDALGATLTGFSGDSDLSFYGLAGSPNSSAATVSDKTGVAKTATLAVGPPNTTITFVNGIAATSGADNGVLTPYNAAGSAVTVHCSDGIASSSGGLGAAGLGLTVNPAAIASYAVSAGSTQGNGATFVTTVTARDAYGNTVTNDSSTVVTLTSSTGNAQFDSDGNGSFGDNTKTLAGGTFAINTRNNVVETLTLTATSSGGITGTSSPVTIATSSAKDILTFTFPTFGAANISGTNIAITVPFGTSPNLAPTYTLSTLATGSPASGSTRNFSTPQTYTVTAQDLSTKDHTVTVTVAPEATTFTWNSASSGNWSVASNWTNNSGLVLAPNAGGNPKYTLNFNQAGTYTPAHDLNNNFQINQLNLGANATISGNSLAFTANGPTLPQISQNTSSAITFSAPLVLNANLTFGGSGNGTVALSGNISGAGSLTKSCSGNMTLSGTNSHSGGTTISTGTVSLGITANTLLGTGTVTLASGCTLALNGNNNLTNAFVLNGGTVTNGNSFSANLNGPITFGATNTFNLGTTGNMTLGGAISGPGGLIKLGTANGPLVLSGASSFTGPVTLSEGILQLSSFNSVSGGTASSNLGAPTTVTDGTISIGSSSTSATLIYNGPGETTDRVIRMAGTTGGATLRQSGTLAGLPSSRGTSGLLKLTSDISIPGSAGADCRKTLTLTGAAGAAAGPIPGTGEISGSIGDSVAGISAAQRATSVTKAGPNTWILSGNNTYTGATAVQAGILAFTRPAALGSAILTISTGAKVRLDYIGTRQIAGLTLNGISQANGSYGSSSSIADNKNDTWFSGPGTVTVGPIANPTTTSLSLTSGANPSNGGASVTFTATVSGTSPTGTVAFFDGLTPLGTATLNASFQASLTTTTLAGGTHAITAQYGGNAGNAPGASAPLTQTVVETRAATTTTLTSGTNPTNKWRPVTFTATVAGASTGSVQFLDGATALGTVALNGSGQASITTASLPVGWRPISARYLGSTSYAPGTTATPLFQTVNPAPGNGKLKVFILAGQSNMQGKALVETGRDPNNLTVTGVAGGLGSLRNMLNRNPAKYGFLPNPANPIPGGSPGWITRSDVGVTYWSGGGASDVPSPSAPARNGNLDPYFGNNGEGPTAGNGRIGPEYAFGLEVGSQLGDNVLLIKYAFGGKSLAVEFRPPGAVAARGGVVGPYYTGMVAKVNQVLANLSTYYPAYTGGGYEIAGFGWHQGWNDRSNSAYTAEYEANMVNLIQDLRTQFSVPNLPVVIGNTGMANAPTGPGSLIEAQNNVGNPALHPEFAGTVTTVDTIPFDYGVLLGEVDEGYHWNWNAESYYNIGESMAKAMMALLPPDSSTPYGAWALDPAQGLTAGVNDGPTDDPDFDGIENQLEFVLGSAPTVSSPAALPTLTKSTGSWVFAYNRSVASRPPGTTQTVEYGNNLSGWTQLPVPAGNTTNVTITPQGNTDRVEVTLPVLGDSGFARLRVTQ